MYRYGQEACHEDSVFGSNFRYDYVTLFPIREGNGRVTRLLSTLMALQADLPQLDFSVLEGPLKRKYFAAVRAGLDRNYKPMKEIFEEVIRKTELSV